MEQSPAWKTDSCSTILKIIWSLFRIPSLIFLTPTKSIKFRNKQRIFYVKTTTFSSPVNTTLAHSLNFYLQVRDKVNSWLSAFSCVLVSILKILLSTERNRTHCSLRSYMSWHVTSALHLFGIKLSLPSLPAPTVTVALRCTTWWKTSRLPPSYYVHRLFRPLLSPGEAYCDLYSLFF
jgi:hypothetical protein